MSLRVSLASAALLSVFLPASAFAASPDAWKAFAAEVEAKCLKAADGLFRRPQIVVDPIGSDRFGLAILHGRSKGAQGRAALICIVDKKTGVVELGSELGPEQIRIRKARPLGEDGKPLPRKNRKMQNDTGAEEDMPEDDTL